MCRKWTEEENEHLRALVTGGASVIRAAAALKRKVKSVRVHAKKLGYPFPPIHEVRKKWTDTPSSFWRQS